MAVTKSPIRGVASPRLAVWVASRLIVAGIVLVTALRCGVDRSLRGSDIWLWVLYRFAHWDSHLYAAVAMRGYVASGPASHYNAFFPGFPAAMRAWGALFGGDVRWGGLLLVLACGAAAALLLGQLTDDVTPGDRTAGTMAVVLLAVAPLTVFFSVVYTEAPFLALSVGAWLAARRDRWLISGVLAALACALRLNGLFLVAGLAVLYYVHTRRSTRSLIRPSALALGLGPAVVVGWAWWLHGLTGSWSSWAVAQQVGWGRSLAWPWVGLSSGIHNVATAGSLHVLTSRLADLLAVVAALAATVHYLRRRNWPIATLVGLNTVTVVFSSILISGPRFLLVWFPLYVSAARWLSRHRLATRFFLVSCTAVASLLTYFWARQWWIA